VPSQFSVKLSPTPVPTAQMLLAETGAIPLNQLLPWFAVNEFRIEGESMVHPSGKLA